MVGSERALLANRYRVVRQLGQGGMGSVWLAEDTQLDNKQFAIKMLPSILVSNKRAYRQLKDEALVAMKLTHPNIVTLRAFEENNGNPFLVMDYIDGQSLDDCLEEWGTLTPGQTVTLLRPVAAALDYAHKQGVVHRDIKPGNIMVRRDGVPFVLDFGIAREMQETMTRVTGKLSSGTLLYMSPEQLNGEKPTPAQDIYSFAAMAYECIKCEPPFSHGQIEFQIMNKDPEPLPNNDAISASIMSGLAKKPGNRPATCGAVLSGGVSALTRVAATRRLNTTGAQKARLTSEASGRRTGEGAAEDGVVRGKGLAVVIGMVIVVGGLSMIVNGLRTAGRNRPPSAVYPAAQQEPNHSDSITPTPSIAEVDAEAEMSVSSIWHEAMASNERLKERSCDDDLSSSREKDVLIKDFSNAETFYNKKQWSKAAVACTNFVNNCKKFMERCDEREEAQFSRKDAERDKEYAKQVEAEKYAANLWRDAKTSWDSAIDLFGHRSFVEAKSKFDSASKMFSTAASEAIKAKREKTAAENIQEQAQLALKAARKSEAESFAVQEWNEAQTSLSTGDFALRCGDYAKASWKFTEAKKKFEASEKKAANVAAHYEKLSKIKVGATVEIVTKADLKQVVVDENRMNRLTVHFNKGSTTVWAEFQYDDIISVSIISEGNVAVAKPRVANRGFTGTGVRPSAETARLVAPTRIYAFETRIVPYIMENGTKKYVDARVDGKLSAGMSMRRETRNGRYEIVIGTNTDPQEILRPSLYYGQYTAKIWLDSGMFDKQQVTEIELK